MSTLRLRIVRCLVPAASCLLLAACASEGKFVYPEFEKLGPREEALDCAGLEQALRRTDAVRWSMREDGIALQQSEPLRRVWGALGVLAGVAAMPIDPGGGAQLAGHGAHFAFSDGPKNSLEQADRRLVRLLQRKRLLGCAASPTDLDATTDFQMLEQIEALNRRREAGEISRKKEVAERSQLLDSLHASGPRDTTPAVPSAEQSK